MNGGRRTAVDPSRRAATARQPLRLTAAALQGTLGASGGRRGSDLPHMDGGQPATAGLLSRTAGGQASEAGRAGCSASAAASMRAALLLPTVRLIGAVAAAKPERRRSSSRAPRHMTRVTQPLGSLRTVQEPSIHGPMQVYGRTRHRGVTNLCSRGASRRTSRGLALQALHLPRLAKMLGPMRVSCDVYRRLP